MGDLSDLLGLFMSAFNLFCSKSATDFEYLLPAVIYKAISPLLSRALLFTLEFSKGTRKSLTLTLIIL